MRLSVSPKLHTRRARVYHRRLIRSGNVVEVYDYEKPVFEGSQNARKGRANEAYTSAETKRENRAKTASRARATVRRMVNANPQLNKFLTLTFAENVTDITRAHYELEKFIKRLKTRCEGFQYLYVIEFQKRGAVHFHLLCNLPYIDVNALAKVWGNGFVKLNRIDKCDNVGAYVTKYMTKDSIDDRLAGRRCYCMSRDLCKPVELTDEQAIEEELAALEDVLRVRTATFESDYYGTITYTQVVCKRAISPQSGEARKKNGRYDRKPPQKGLQWEVPQRRRQEA